MGRIGEQAKALMREYVIKLKFRPDGKSWTEIWCNDEHFILHDSRPSTSRVWRAKLRLRAKDVVGAQPDANFSIQGEVIKAGEKRVIGKWSPGERTCWFGATPLERGTQRNRPERPRNYALEAKDRAILATARPL